MSCVPRVSQGEGSLQWRLNTFIQIWKQTSHDNFVQKSISVQSQKFFHADKIENLCNLALSCLFLNDLWLCHQEGLNDPTKSFRMYYSCSFPSSWCFMCQCQLQISEFLYQIKLGIWSTIHHAKINRVNIYFCVFLCDM